MPDGKWYTDAVIWASANGITNGVGGGKFNPNALVTREQLAAFLFRFTGAEAPKEDHMAEFADAASVSSYSVDAMNWAVSEGLLSGSIENGMKVLNSSGTATRAQFAVILMRMLKD